MNAKMRYIGENVRRARLNRGLTIEQLAELADISDSFLGVAERGTSGFSIESIVKLARALHISTDALLLQDMLDNELSPKAETLMTLVSRCTDAELDFMIEYVKLCKKMGIFKVATP